MAHVAYSLQHCPSQTGFVFVVPSLTIIRHFRVRGVVTNEAKDATMTEPILNEAETSVSVVPKKLLTEQEASESCTP